VLHGLQPRDLDERLVPGLATQVHDVDELSSVLTGLVLTTVPDPLEAWTRYYRQSLAQLRRGLTELAPVHEHAAGLIWGTSVLDLGSCFGFLALRLAQDGTAVTASDICPGTMRLLARVAPELGVPIGTLRCDAADVPLPEACVDTVTAVHLLEHLDPEHGRAVLAEALRLAHRRVVIAVPYEQTPNAAYGHVRAFTAAHLRALGDDEFAGHAAADAGNPEAPNIVTPPGNPALIGLPSFIVGAIALGLVLVGYVPAAAVGASIPIILTATGLGQTIAAVWAASLGESAVASVFGVFSGFSGFWLSYAALVLGLTHNWYGITSENALGVQKLFLLTWFIVIVMLTLVSLRLPLAFTVLFVLVDIALALVYFGTANASTTVTEVGGIAVFAFVLVGMYLYMDAMSAATGGRTFPQGTPLLH